MAFCCGTYDDGRFLSIPSASLLPVLPPAGGHSLHGSLVAASVPPLCIGGRFLSTPPSPAMPALPAPSVGISVFSHHAFCLASNRSTCNDGRSLSTPSAFRFSSSLAATHLCVVSLIAALCCHSGLALAILLIDSPLGGASFAEHGALTDGRFLSIPSAPFPVGPHPRMSPSVASALPSCTGGRFLSTPPSSDTVALSALSVSLSVFSCYLASLAFSCSTYGDGQLLPTPSASLFFLLPSTRGLSFRGSSVAAPLPFFCTGGRFLSTPPPCAVPAFPAPFPGPLVSSHHAFCLAFYCSTCNDGRFLSTPSAPQFPSSLAATYLFEEVSSTVAPCCHSGLALAFLPTDSPPGGVSFADQGALPDGRFLSIPSAPSDMEQARNVQVSLRRGTASHCDRVIPDAEPATERAGRDHQSHDSFTSWLLLLADWSQNQLEIIGRSLALMYLLSVFRVFLFSTPLAKGDACGNATIRDGRRLLRGAPLLLALFWCLPVCCGMQHGRPSGTFRSPSASHGDFPQPPPSSPPVLSGSVRAGISSNGPGDDMRPLARYADVYPGVAQSVKAVAVAYRFQRSVCFAAEWIDPDDPLTLVVQNFSVAFLGEAPDDTLLPVFPQPCNSLVSFLLVPSWSLDLLLTPVLFQVYQPSGPVRFLDFLPGRVGISEIQDAVGQLWPQGGNVFIEDSLSPLADDEIAHLRPGSMISVCRHRRSFPLTQPLSHKLHEPKFWFRDFDDAGFPPDRSAEVQFGVLGGGSLCSTLRVSAMQTPQQLRNAVSQEVGVHDTSFRLAAPSRSIPDLSFRGTIIQEVLGIVPRTLDICMAVFVDARDLACPVQMLLLPPFRMTLSALLLQIGAHRPDFRQLHVRGSASFCSRSETFMPEHNAVISISVLPRWREGLDNFVDPPPPSDHDRPFSDFMGSVPRPGTHHPRQGTDATPAPGSQQHGDGMNGPSCSTPPADEPDRPLVPAVSTKTADIPEVPDCERQVCSAEHHKPQGHGTLWPFPPDAFVITKEEQALQLALPSDLTQDVVYKESLGAPATDFPPEAVHRVLGEAGEDVESSPLTEDPETAEAPTEWPIGVRVLSFQKRPVYTTAWVAAGETVQSWLVRANIILAPLDGFHELLVPESQPGDGLLTVLLTPTWWRRLSMNAVLVSRVADATRAHVAIARPATAVPDVLPLHGQLAAETTGTFANDEHMTSPLGRWHPAPATTIVYQRAGLEPPHLPTAQQFLGDARNEMRRAALPVSESPPLLRRLLLGPGFEQAICEIEFGALAPHVERVTGIPARRLVLSIQRGSFTDLAVQGVPVSKCISYRDRELVMRPHSPTLYIDGRALGVPVCSRMVQGLEHSAVAIAALIQAEVPPSMELLIAGGRPLEDAPQVFRFQDRDTVTIWAQLRLPLEPGSADLEDVATAGGHDTPPADGDGAASAGAKTRSRSPRRAPATSQPALLPSAGHVDSHLPCYSSGCEATCNVTWKPGSRYLACAPCHPADTSGRLASLQPVITTVLDESPVAARLSWMSQVWDSLESQAAMFGSSLLPGSTDLNCKELPCEGPCTIHLEHLLGQAVTTDCHHSPVLPLDPPANLGSCKVNWSQDKMEDLLTFMPWNLLRAAPDGLEKPWRFNEWLKGQQLGVRPSPEEELCVHADGSFDPNTRQAGWGLVFSKRRKDSPNDDGVFLGCAWGSYSAFAPFLSAFQHALDAHLMEALGLMWAAIAILQLRFFGQVRFESDCQSAITSAQGTSKTRQHPICKAMAALHLCIRIAMPFSPQYSYVPGHCGTARNELADALARLGANGPTCVCPISLTVSSWFDQDLDGFAWAPHFFMCRERPHCMPLFSGNEIRWDPTVPAFRDDPVKALQPFLPSQVFQAARPAGKVVTLQIKLVSFNALSIVDATFAPEPGHKHGLYAATGRTALLAGCLQDRQVLFAGIQEARTPEGSVVSNGFLRLSTGPDLCGNLGIEIWVNLNLPLGPAQASGLKLQRSDAAVVHAEPSCMIVRITSPALNVVLASLHAPHRAHSLQHRIDWWRRITNVCLQVDCQDAWLLTLDGNIRVGSCTSQSIGDWQADPEDEAAQVAHGLFQRLRVFLPATFKDNMIGDGGTLYQKRGGRLDRSDFIALPLAWVDQCPTTWVDAEIHAGHRGLDHLAVVAEVWLRQSHQSSKKAGQLRIDAAAIRDGANRDKICRIIADAPSCDWHVNVHEHAAAVVSHLQTALAEAFPAQKHRPRPSFLSDFSMGLHHAIAGARSKLKCRCMALRCARLRCAFQVWRSQNAGRPFLHALQGNWLAELHCNIAVDIFRIQTYSLLLRRSSRKDKAAFLSRLADDLRDAAPNDVHAAFKVLVRPARKCSGKTAPLPRLRKLDGSLCRDFEEVQARWREHFSMLEAGCEVTPAGLVANCFDGQQARPPLLHISGHELPSMSSLSDAMRATAGRKAAGPDHLPPDLCRRFGGELSLIWFPVLLKTLLLSSEAIGLKGTVLHRIPKPGGARSECLSHRAIVVQSCLAKVVQKCIRHLLSEKLDKTAHPLVFGGRSGCSAVFGSFLSRAFVRVTRARHVSASLVFCDLASAYYRVIRELLAGRDSSSPSVKELCAGLSLADADLQFISDAISSEPVLAQDSDFLQRTVQEAGLCSWFLMAQDHQIVQTRRGTRPGGPIADLLFSILFVRALETRRLDQCMDSVPQFKWDGVRALQQAPGVHSAFPTLPVRDIVYADDLSICSVSRVAAEISLVTSHAAGRAMDCFAQNGFIANMGASKTAALVMPRGTGSRAVRLDLYGHRKGLLPVLRDTQGQVQLPLVHQYSHLGGLLTHTGSLQGEIRRRLNLARATFKEAKRLVFACKAIPLAKRVSLFQGRVLSVLFYAAGSWPVLNAGETKEFFGGFMALCRQLLVISTLEDQKWTEQQILYGVGLPSPQVCLHIERLRFLLLLSKTGPDELWAVARADDGFLQAQHSALAWLRVASRACSGERLSWRFTTRELLLCWTPLCGTCGSEIAARLPCLMLLGPMDA